MTEVEESELNQIAPPYELFYQQGLGESETIRIRRRHFQSFAVGQAPAGPVVLSVDPGHGGGKNASRSVIQAWVAKGEEYYLLDQFCEQCRFSDLRRQFRLFVKKYRPSVALIENTADGPALFDLVRQMANFDVRLVNPGRRSKAVRLTTHLLKIRKRQIFLPAMAPWRDEFVNEFVTFPGQHDDQIDAFTQYLDLIDTRPFILIPPVRAGSVASAALVPSSAAPLQCSGGSVALGSAMSSGDEDCISASSLFPGASYKFEKSQSARLNS